MTQLAHRIYIGTMASIVVLTFMVLLIKGIPYYSTSIEERFYHPDHALFKPSGVFGHGLGIVGTLLILIGVFGYQAKKRFRWLTTRFGRLKYWLEFHIFLCSLGPVMILFHTAFKFGGIVSISFWSMVAVVASGIIGRFIYVQIPRTIEGRELSIQEIQGAKANLSEVLNSVYHLNEASKQAIFSSIQAQPVALDNGLFGKMMHQYFEDKKTLRNVRQTLLANEVPKGDVRQVANLVGNEITLNRRIERLQIMRKLFRYWHVAHLPFALIMLVIMVVHVVVTLMMGARWVF
ncbi:MAG: hypothetical protein IT258_20795 [Saprospiraceae bacterium]|nr:hypothetical protein [Saprospiraceae bacterium]